MRYYIYIAWNLKTKNATAILTTSTAMLKLLYSTFIINCVKKCMHLFIYYILFSFCYTQFLYFSLNNTGKIASFSQEVEYFFVQIGVVQRKWNINLKRLFSERYVFVLFQIKTKQKRLNNFSLVKFQQCH